MTHLAVYIMLLSDLVLWSFDQGWSQVTWYHLDGKPLCKFDVDYT